jgi:hypothetical protein
MRKLVAAGAIALGIATLPVTAAHAATTWIVSVKASATTVDAGHKVTFTGSVRPHGAAAGEKVVLQERSRPGAKWKDQTKGKIDRSGRYSVSDKPTFNTLHSYRVVMPTVGKHTRSVSQTVKVTVYDWVDLLALGGVNWDGMGTGTIDINGTSYEDSIVAGRARATVSVEFNLDHKCDQLRSTFGIDDDSSTGGEAEVGVLSDGTSVYDNTFDLGQSETKSLALDAPLKIKLLATDKNTTDGTFGYGAFGTPQAHCTQ